MTGWDIHHHGDSPAGISVRHHHLLSAPLSVSGFLSAGLLPHEFPADLSLLADAVHGWAGHPRLLAWGECGLDRRTPPAKTSQLEQLTELLRLFRLHPRPLILHSVGHHGALMALIEGHWPHPFLLHSFLGPVGRARAWLERGAFLSLGPSWLKHPQRTELLAAIPDDRLLLESDACPDLFPELCTEVARTGGWSPEELDRMLRHNWESMLADCSLATDLLPKADPSPQVPSHG